MSQDFGENKYSKKYQSDNTKLKNMSQVFGENKYSKIIKVTMQINNLIIRLQWEYLQEKYQSDNTNK